MEANDELIGAIPEMIPAITHRDGDMENFCRASMENQARIVIPCHIRGCQSMAREPVFSADSGLRRGFVMVDIAVPRQALLV
jgi:hypothetical protein